MLTKAYQRKFEDQALIALARMTELQFSNWCVISREYEEQGFVPDVAFAKACDDVFGGNHWRRFRKMQLANT